ncbi:protein TonB [Rhizobium leguminosarum]|uniref:Protein TonB n=1 Tax=Rhizobium leguminosarum TaxID=384 RepID=A0AAE2MKF8_RHILE|nr:MULTISPECIES: TonB C-terminal domain-containing protein [Rhizobium]MBB4290927.1 protein TonB [Rhizobium leguminosarum]MBB4297977.1 protein TonB [Rhizobium leguminosarum]MBB4309116.1 protein TonB [Rhizobium leguminosarum]MBB4416953.1 protein TonB [Rhizobium leguminosarum]MBB4430078.1 protein TonB [Rhizobium esperanzae]
MAISAKSRSRQVLIGEPDADGSLNDNNMHPGHELSDLRNVQRQPAGEAVVHYARFAQIPSFPDHPEAEPIASVPAPPMDAVVEKQEDEKKPVRRRVALACVSSLIFHATLAAVLIIVFPTAPDETLMEAGEAISVVMLGSSDADQSAAGETEVTIQQEIVPEAVEPDTVKPVETAEMQPEAVQPETVQPTDAEPVEAVQPTQEVTRQSAETVTTAEPEVLVSQTSAETSVAQPMSTVVPEQSPEIPVTSAEPPAATALQSEPEEIKPVETAAMSPEPEPPAEIATPQPKPKLEKPAEKKPVERKQPPKKAQGSAAEAKQESRRGAADGQADANSDNNSRTAGGRSGSGGAAEANYKGKIVSRLFRCVDRIESRYRRDFASLNVRITINRNGDITASGIVQGSGLAEVDGAVLSRIASCNLPAMPDDWAGSSRSYSFPVQVTAR